MNELNDYVFVVAVDELRPSEKWVFNHMLDDMLMRFCEEYCKCCNVKVLGFCKGE